MPRSGFLPNQPTRSLRRKILGKWEAVNSWIKLVSHAEVGGGVLLSMKSYKRYVRSCAMGVSSCAMGRNLIIFFCFGCLFIISSKDTNRWKNWGEGSNNSQNSEPSRQGVHFRLRPSTNCRLYRIHCTVSWLLSTQPTCCKKAMVWLVPHLSGFGKLMSFK